ncbi:MAG: cryptochrome/photolyase family protein [Candidatus Zhuqueibacterota bacterium]
MHNILRLILGDQLSPNHTWFSSVSSDVLYVMMEVRQETDYAQHHIQKVLAFFAAMRAFAEYLRQRGHTVHYIQLDAPDNRQSFPDNLTELIRTFAIKRFEYQSPDEYRLDQQLKSFCKTLSIPSAEVDSQHFLSQRGDVRDRFPGKKHYVMEMFYRAMRKTHRILLDGEKPIGGTWNFDAANRRRYRGDVPAPAPLEFHNDIAELKKLVTKMKVSTIGRNDGDQLSWLINRDQALQVLDYFIRHGLPHFGAYQDAMTTASESLFHSRLSFALNTKMLHPLEVITAATQAWQDQRTTIDLNQVEGFVRQILGWREYVRGVYWANMPEYAGLNFFEASRPLPHYYWDGDTKMACMRQVIRQSLNSAYAHHIQRLMVTGNFAQLVGVSPDHVDAWYLGIYIDAIEWVEITNTRGMSQFADGGLMATKPYNSTANYIHKMSDYCEGCYYSHQIKYGDRACPFNSLYWAFYFRNRERLAANPRIQMVYRTMDRIAQDELRKILGQAQHYLDRIEAL